MYNTTILKLLIQFLGQGSKTPAGYSAGLFGGTYFAQSYFAGATGGLGEDARIAQVHAIITLLVGTQAVTTINNVSISQVGATLTLTGGAQAVTTVNNVAITQVHASLTLTGGTQSLSSMVDIAIAQQAANLTLAGGTQSVYSSTVSASIIQTAAILTLMGGTQSVGMPSIVTVPVQIPDVDIVITQPRKRNYFMKPPYSLKPTSVPDPNRYNKRFYG